MQYLKHAVSTGTFKLWCWKQDSDAVCRDSVVDGGSNSITWAFLSAHPTYLKC